MQSQIITMPNPTTKYGYQQSINVPKPIILTGKFLQFISPSLAAKFAARLFRTPFKHAAPKREHVMDSKSKQHRLTVTGIEKEIVVYEYGESDRKILLAHGWSGRGTQLVKIADALLEQGYSTVSFDAPAHGKTSDKVTDMREFIASILYIEQEFGPFEAAVGHSLGGMSLLNAIKQGLKVDHLATVGCGDIVTHIMADFISKLELKPSIGQRMLQRFEDTFNEQMDDYSASLAAKDVHIPVLVIHDENDLDVPVSAAHNIRQNLSDGQLYITQGYGHRKILGKKDVIRKIVNFISEKN